MATFNGTSGNDTLRGTTASDLLAGGKGNDLLYGNSGADTYSFFKGDGDDFIQDYDTTTGNTDVVNFADVKSTEVSSVLRSGDDLILKYGASDQLLINFYFNSAAYVVEQFRFSDGVTWGEADIKSRAVHNGTAGIDTLYAYKNGPNTINGLGGNDTIYGGDGNDILDGGDGNDRIFGQSSGNKILRGGAGNDYLSAYTGTGNNMLDGGSGDDEIYGGSGKDTLIGGDGNDKIYGGNGGSTLDGGSGVNLLQGGSGNDSFIVSNLTTRIVDTGGIDTAIVNTNFFKIPDFIETVTYAKGAQALPYWVDALTPSSSSGDYFKNLLSANKIFTYSFPSALPSYLRSSEDAWGWQPFNLTQKTFARQTLDYIASVIDVKFVESATSDSLNNITFSNNQQFGSEGYAFFPNSGLIGSDLFLNRSAGNLNPKDGNYAALTLIHELGHALGLKHTFNSADADGNFAEGPFLPTSEETTAWTVMSYSSQPAQYHATYQPFDIAALQYLYGVNSSYRPGNDVYTVNTVANHLIYDGGGSDALDASQQSLGSTISLEPGYWSFIGTKAPLISAPGQISINFGTRIEKLMTGSGNDSVSGNSADNEIDAGLGLDTALYNSSLANYALSKTAIGFMVKDKTGADGTDTLNNIERLQFTDARVALDISGNAGTVAKILGAVFGAAAVTNKTYVGIGLNYMDSGMSYANLTQLAIDARLGGRSSNTDVVSLLYTNVVGSAPDAANLAFYKGQLDDGSFTQGTLGVLAADTGLNTTNINLVGLSQTGIEFTL